MTIKKRLSVICLTFGIIPLLIVFGLGIKSGLGTNGEFQSGIALALMVMIFLGLFSAGFIRYWFIGKQLEKIRAFCLSVQDGCYDVFLPVPNESSDIEDENEMVELMRNMNWMAHHIKLNEIQLQSVVANLEQSQGKIIVQNQELEQAYTQQMVVQEQLEDQTQQLTELVGKTRNLLDHAGQGFISFGEELMVAEEYSAECVFIFNREIAREKIPQLLYPQDAQQQEFIGSLLLKILSATDNFLRESYQSLLPTEIVIDGNYIKIDYKFINHPGQEKQHQIMLILTDRTKEKAMETKIIAEKATLSMIVKVVNQYNDFSDAVAGYTAFCHEEVTKVLAGGSSAVEQISTLFTMVHTWKGTFAQLGMEHIAGNLHELEENLEKLRDNKKTTESDLRECFPLASGEKLYSWLAQELVTLEEILGNEFFKQKDKISIEKVKISKIYQDIEQLPDSHKKQAVLLELEMLTYKPFRELLQAYPAHVVELGERYGKKVIPFSITGGESLVNPKIYHKFVQTLVHVFRNAVAHGLETRDERIAVGKEEAGTIQCEIVENKQEMIIHIIDDGRGIDGLKIKKLAVEKNLIDAVAASSLSHEDVCELIFADGFSSAMCTDDIAGRGVGLYAIRREVEKLGGRVTVTSELGMGTEFSFRLPMPIKKEKN